MLGKALTIALLFLGLAVLSACGNDDNNEAQTLGGFIRIEGMPYTSHPWKFLPHLNPKTGWFAILSMYLTGMMWKTIISKH